MVVADSIVIAAEPAVSRPRRFSPHLGVVPTASMITGAAMATVWFWIPLAILIFGITAIPSGIGFLLAAVVFIYLMRGVEWVERVRSEAVFGLGIPVPPRRLSHYSGFQRWAHQLWLDVSSARFWKSCGHHYLRMVYDLAAVGLAVLLTALACHRVGVTWSEWVLVTVMADSSCLTIAGTRARRETVGPRETHRRTVGGGLPPPDWRENAVLSAPRSP